MDSLEQIAQKLDRIIELLENQQGVQKKEFVELPNKKELIDISEVTGVDRTNRCVVKDRVYYFIIIRKQDGTEQEIDYGWDDEWHRGPFHTTSDRAYRTSLEDFRFLKEKLANKEPE